MPPPDLPTLRRLHAWLTAERWGSSLGLLAVVVPLGLVAGALTLAAVAFTPVLVHSLWRLKRTGWLVAFGGTVGPALACGPLLPGAWGAMRGGLALLAFYLFTWALSLAAAEWLSEAEHTARFRRAEAARAADLDAGVVLRA